MSGKCQYGKLIIKCWKLPVHVASILEYNDMAFHESHTTVLVDEKEYRKKNYIEPTSTNISGAHRHLYENAY